MSGNRSAVLNKKFKVNQIRNAIYAYIKVLNERNIPTNEIVEKLKIMGHQIAKTYIRYWKPEFKDELDLMREIHRSVFKTAARVRTKDSEIDVTSRSCPLCKYKREGIEVSGCNIIVGFIESMYELLSEETPELSKVKGTVETSRIFGDKYCKYTFKKL
ncbi:MAG: hypothetical protein ACTSRS_18745 [Candidatus Helarchaeota archaeon]